MKWLIVNSVDKVTHLLLQAVNYTPHQMAMLAGCNTRGVETYAPQKSTLKSRMGSVCDLDEVATLLFPASHT